MMYNQIKFGHKKISSSKDNSRNSHILITKALNVTLTLKLAHKSFCVTLAHDDASQYKFRYKLLPHDDALPYQV